MIMSGEDDFWLEWFWPAIFKYYDMFTVQGWMNWFWDYLSILFFFSEEILNLFGEGYVVAKNALITLLAAQFFNAFSGPGAIYLKHDRPSKNFK